MPPGHIRSLSCQLLSYYGLATFALKKRKRLFILTRGTQAWWDDHLGPGGQASPQPLEGDGCTFPLGDKPPPGGTENSPASVPPGNTRGESRLRGQEALLSWAFVPKYGEVISSSFLKVTSGIPVSVLHQSPKDI